VTPDRIEMLGIARAERERLGRTIQYAPAASWEGDSVCAGWRNSRNSRPADSSLPR